MQEHLPDDEQDNKASNEALDQLLADIYARIPSSENTSEQGSSWCDLEGRSCILDNPY